MRRRSDEEDPEDFESDEEDEEDEEEESGPAADMSDPWPRFLAAASDEEICERFSQESYSLLCEKHSSVADRYACFVMADEHRGIEEFELTRIYNALRRRNPEKDEDVLLIVVSYGGQIEPAYQISKLSRDYAADQFVVAIPRRAKSAATLLALGAHEIHIGPLGHLGPIDPQLKGLPALAVRQALDTIASITERYPGSSDMFASYLRTALSVEQIGYSERISESAVHYADRLLSQQTELPRPSLEIAKHLIHDYKDHSFVIDIHEAQDVLGASWVRGESPELDFADELYGLFAMVNQYLSFSGNGHLVLAGEVGEAPLLIRDDPD